MPKDVFIFFKIEVNNEETERILKEYDKILENLNSLEEILIPIEDFLYWYEKSYSLYSQNTDTFSF